jgi:lysophospholipase L1-like esterase
LKLRPVRQKLKLGALALVLASIGPTAVVAGPGRVGYPTSMASTGDSITRAFNTGGYFRDAPENSWSTGSNAEVGSHYSRILAAEPAIEGRGYNKAVTGAKMRDLLAQVENVNARSVAYVTVLMGANDACTRSESSMTPVATFRGQFQTALETLSADSPKARIFVASIPNIYRLWRILKDNLLARIAWRVLNICQSLLEDPRSNDPDDVARRQRVRDRVIAFNQQLLEVCRLYIHCRFDNNAVFSFPFSAEHTSKRDYFHPSLEGQGQLAEITWTATFDFTDQIAPVSRATVTPGEAGFQIVLQATDDAGVSGIEFRLNRGPWERYLGPLSLLAGDELRFRAVDVNGNTETTHVLIL